MTNLFDETINALIDNDKTPDECHGINLKVLQI